MSTNSHIHTPNSSRKPFLQSRSDWSSKRGLHFEQDVQKAHMNGTGQVFTPFRQYSVCKHKCKKGTFLAQSADFERFIDNCCIDSC